MNERPLGVEEVELVVETGPGGGDGGSVRKHAERSGNLGEVASGNKSGGLVTDTELESGRAPVNELDGALGTDVGNGGVDVLGDNVSTVKETACHVLAAAGVALDHLVVGLEARDGHLGDRVGLVEGLLGGDDRSVGGEGEVDTGEGDKVGLELVEVDVEGAVKAERGSDRRDDLSDKTVKVGERRRGNAEVATANVVDSLVVDHEGAVRVLEGGVGGEDRVVGLYDRGGHFRGRVD